MINPKTSLSGVAIRIGRQDAVLTGSQGWLPLQKLNSLVLLLGFLLHSAMGAEILFIKGAVVHRINESVLSPGDVLVEHGKITQVGPGLKSPDAATVIAAEGLHLYPGLILASTSLGLMEINAVRATLDTTEVGNYHPEVKSWTALNPDSELLPVTRANGITHVVPVPSGGIVSGQSGLVALDGWTAEEMTVKKPAALHLFWPDEDLNLTPRELAPDKAKWKSLEDQVKERRKKLKELDDFFAEALSYATAREKGGSPTSPFIHVPAWEAMLPFIRGEIPLVIHASEARQIRGAVQWSKARKFKIILAGARDAGEVAALLAENKVPVIFDSVFAQPAHDYLPYDVYFKAPADLAKAGVKVIFSVGLGGYTPAMARNVPYATAQAVAFGLPSEEALKGLTLYPAQILGVENRLGSIETGKEATFFLANGDILDIRSNVVRLWIAGREVSLESRHTRLYDKYRQRPLGQ